MKSRYWLGRLSLFLFGMFWLGALSASGEAILSDEASTRLAAEPDTPVRLWLFFDSTAIASEPIALSERALLRRAKVDPVNFLIDQHDYPLRQNLLDSLTSLGLTIRHRSRWLRALSLEINGHQLELVRTLPGLKQIELVRSHTGRREIELEHVFQRQPVAFDSAFYGPSFVQNHMMRSDKLHAAGLTGKSVLIAIFDSGFNPNHHVFDSTSLLATWDFINAKEAVDGRDCDLEIEGYHQDRHGTATWSVIGGYVPDTLIGVAWEADFVLAKTEITCGGTEIKIEEDNWIAAAEWADSIGAEIITASLGYFQFTDSGSYTPEQLDGNTARITQAADLAASKNILVIVSAGNERRSAWGHINFPADGDSVLAVGAVYADRSVTNFSSPGPSADGRIKPDISNLGAEVWAARSITDGWMQATGTSFSAPLTAAGAALALQHDPTMTAAELFNLIKTTGSQADNPDNNIGFGLFDAVRAADILTWEPIESPYLGVRQRLTLPLATSGRTRLKRTLRGLNLPETVSLRDFGDGTGALDMIGQVNNLGRSSFDLIASAGTFEDTTRVTITTYILSENAIRAGPNPFRDSVAIFLDPEIRGATKTVRITIFNISGEKIAQIVKSGADIAETIVWEAHNGVGRQIAPGLYVMLVQTDVLSRQLKLLKLE